MGRAGAGRRSRPENYSRRGGQNVLLQTNSCAISNLQGSLRIVLLGQAGWYRIRSSRKGGQGEVSDPCVQGIQADQAAALGATTGVITSES